MKKYILAITALAFLATPLFAADGLVLHVHYKIFDFTQDYKTQPYADAATCEKAAANYLASSFAASLRANGGVVVAGCE